MNREPERPNGLKDRVDRIEKLLDQHPPQTLYERQRDQNEDITWLKRALWGLVFAVLLAVATYFVRLGAAPPAG